MEASHRQRKRKQPSSNPFTCILTRQRSQIFTHTTRSGKSRPDPFRQIFKFQKSRHPQDDHDHAPYHMSIKDLRARRIFSKPLVPKVRKTASLATLLEVESGMNLNPNLCISHNDGKFKNPTFNYEPNDVKLKNPNLFPNPNDMKLENPNLFVEPVDLKEDAECEGFNKESPSSSNSTGKNPNSTVMERCDGVVESKGEGLIDENPNSLLASSEGSDAKLEISGSLDTAKKQNIDVGFKGIAKISNVVSERDLKGRFREERECFTDDNVQTTPPDELVHILQADDGIALNNRNGCLRLPVKKTSATTDKQNSFDSERNKVLKACSRMKLYKAPYSFSYRRLLPYLMDMANDTPCAPKINPCTKTVIDAAEKSLVSSSQESIIDTPKFDEKLAATLPSFTPQEASISRKELEGPLEFKGSDLMTEQAVVETFVNCSQDKGLVNWVSPQSEIKPPIKNDSKKGVLPHNPVAFDCTGTLRHVSATVKPNQVDSSMTTKGSSETLRKDANSEAHCQLALYDGKMKIPNLLVAGKCDSKENIECEGLNGGGPNLSTSDKCDSSLVELCDRGVDFKEKGSSDKNTNSFVASTVGSDINGKIAGLSDDAEVLNGAKKQKFDVGFNCSAKVSNPLSSNIPENECEDNVQTTPSEAVVYIQQGDDGIALQTRNICSRSPPKKISPSKENKNCFDSHKNMVLKPCSRMKLFKAPYSFSYRRLLPYLMDMENDTPDAPAVNPCPKTEIGAGENALASSFQEGVTTETNNFDVNGSLELSGSNLKSEQGAIVSCSQDKSEVKLLSPRCQIRNKIENYSQKADRVDSSKQSPGALNNDVNRGGEFQLALYPQSECKLKDVVSSPLVDCVAKGGILKRNPRGCRGICDCLNCTSFRLNAGKAFEFSRNQMLDTQELVHDMMNEISNLRLMLQKSADSHAILPADQVQEACKRASAMEDTARSRLTEMKQDLFVHCRTKSLERPRVNFSSHVQEKQVQK